MWIPDRLHRDPADRQERSDVVDGITSFEPPGRIGDGGAAVAVGLARVRFTVDQYERMAEAGILDEDDRVELIGGEIVRMAALGARHVGAVIRGTRVLNERLGERAIVSVQNPVRLPEDDEPQPDLTVLRWREDLYAGRLPAAADALLVVEVADTTLRRDRNVKGPVYARHGIADYWIVDLAHDALVVLREPGPADYRSERVLRRGEAVAPLAFPEVEIAAEELLGA